MKPSIPRYRQRYAAFIAGGLAVAILALVVAWLFMVVWTRGGPQPVHPIVVAIPAPHMTAAAGGPA